MKRAMFAATLVTFAAASSAEAGCSSLQSSPSNQPADVKFVNGSASNVDVLWYKFKGGTRKYRRLAPHQSYVQATYRNHVWAFTDAKGKCLATYTVTGSGTYVIP